jgi:hypothetical protein
VLSMSARLVDSVPLASRGRAEPMRSGGCDCGRMRIVLRRPRESEDC